MRARQTSMRGIPSLLMATICIALSIVPSAGGAKKKTAYLVVSAGLFERTETVVAFELPPEFKGASYMLKDEVGRTIPLQLDSGGKATFVLVELAAGKKKTFRLIEGRAGSRTPTAKAELTGDGSRVSLILSGRKVLNLVAKPAELPSDIKPVFLRGGYLHPVYTPSGRMVTDDYPPDHYHHHGIWFAWTRTQFEGGRHDFWNVGDGTGRIEFEKVEATWNGQVHSGFRSRQRYVALTGSAPKTALNEEWEVQVYSVGQGSKRYFMFDVTAIQQCATASPLVLEEYRYGGMGVRGHRDWKDRSKVVFLTSEGKTRENGNGTRGRWCHIGGPVDGQPVGIAILDHPSNFRAPNPMRLNPDDPFFNYAPTQLGKFEIKPGAPFVLRYRYIVSDGSADATELDRIWNDFASPPQVSVVHK